MGLKVKVKGWGKLHTVNPNKKKGGVAILILEYISEQRILPGILKRQFLKDKGVTSSRGHKNPECLCI